MEEGAQQAGLTEKSGHSIHADSNEGITNKSLLPLPTAEPGSMATQPGNQNVSQQDETSSCQDLCKAEHMSTCAHSDLELDIEQPAQGCPSSSMGNKSLDYVQPEHLLQDPEMSSDIIPIKPKRGRPPGSRGRGKSPRPVEAGRGVLVSPVCFRGRGRPPGSVGRGRPPGSIGRGRPPGSVGRGRPHGSVGRGRPHGSVGRGRPHGSVKRGRPKLVQKGLLSQLNPPETSPDYSSSSSFSSQLLSPDGKSDSSIRNITSPPSDSLSLSDSLKPGHTLEDPKSLHDTDSGPSSLSTSFNHHMKIAEQLPKDPTAISPGSSAYPLSDLSHVKKGPEGSCFPSFDSTNEKGSGSGKPLKNPDNSCSTISDPLAIKRGSGQPPPKNISTTPDKPSLQTDSLLSPKRKRGRPPKATLSIVNTSAFSPASLLTSHDIQGAVHRVSPGGPVLMEFGIDGCDQSPRNDTDLDHVQSPKGDMNLNQGQSQGADYTHLHNTTNFSPKDIGIECDHSKQSQEEVNTSGEHHQEVNVSQPPRQRGRPRKDSALRFKQQTDTTAKAPTSDIWNSSSDWTSVHQTDDTFVLPKHSTPVVSSWRDPNGLGTSVSAASPIEGRRSGRDRKKTEKGEDLEEYLRQQRSNSNAPDSDIQQNKIRKKRGRPRKDSSVTDSSVKGSNSITGNDQAKTIPQHHLTSVDKTNDESENSFSCSLLTPKKKRGRPRKNTSLTPSDVEIKIGVGDSSTRIEAASSHNVSWENSPDMPKTSPEKRGRGRPRKIVVVSDDDEEAMELSDDSVSEHDTKTVAEYDSVASVRVPVKRKRGRPRKSDSITGNTAVETNVTGKGTQQIQSMKESRGDVEDARGSDNSETAAGEAAEAVPQKRGRGRPRKSELLASTSGQAESTPRKRGQPRKKYVELSNAESPDDPDNDLVSEEEAEVVPVKKKRGRPRKYIDDEASQSAKGGSKPSGSQGGIKIEKCLRCGEAMDSQASYVTHLRSRHAALYTKNCPEGEQSHAAWMKIVKLFKKVNCPDCQKQFKNVQFFKFHLRWCGREEEKATCEQCGHTLKAMWMYHHQLYHRKLERQQKEEDERQGMQEEESDRMGEESGKRKAATAALKTLQEAYKDDGVEERESKSKRRKVDDNWTCDGAEDENEDDEDDDSEVYDDDDKNPGRGNKKKRRICNQYFKITSIREASSSDSRKILFPRVTSTDFFLEHDRFLKQLENPEWHCDLIPLTSQWVPLPERETSKHLPSYKQSVCVSVGQVQSGNNARSTTLQWGETLCDNSQATGFVGGQVLSAEWCPLDMQTSRGQVLAVSAGRTMWEEGTPIFINHQEPGAIQFWSTGTLDCVQSSCSPDLRLSFTLAHDSGHVVSMAWCPRGAFSKNLPSGGDTLQRLGLLAVAGWDSAVHIYSIPTPESLSGDQAGETGAKSISPSIFKPSPSLTLTCVNPEEYGPCLSVSWQKGEGCDFIAAGYAEGYVHLWHLSSTWQRSGLTGNTLSPVRSFVAHGSAVLSIDWSWQEASHFVTGSLDCDFKVWDMENTTVPVFCPQDNRRDMRGPIRAVMYGSAALDAVIIADDQRDKYSGAVIAMDMSGCRGMSVLNKHAATIWACSYSDWFSVTVSGDSTGLLSMSNCLPILNPRMKRYTHKRKGMPVFSTSFSTDGKESENGGSELEPPSPGDVHVKFIDRSMKSPKSWADDEELSPCNQNFDMFQGADVMSVSFNPNKTSSQWIAVGTRAGFLRLLRLCCLSDLYRSSRKFFRGQDYSEKETSVHLMYRDNPFRKETIVRKLDGEDGLEKERFEDGAANDDGGEKSQDRQEHFELGDRSQTDWGDKCTNSDGMYKDNEENDLNRDENCEDSDEHGEDKDKTDKNDEKTDKT